jgi:hypothetical protein
MMGFKSKVGCLALIFVVGVAVGSASAGLVGTGLAYNDGAKTWDGTVPFSKTSGSVTLAGSMDWAVFTAANFNTLFGGSGYTPHAGELVYTYQLHNTGNTYISLSELVLISQAPADTAGYFSLGGSSEQAPYSSTITSGDVVWSFQSPNNIAVGAYSTGLAFSSIRKPRSDFDIVFNGGVSVTFAGMGGPGPNSIPEPSALALLTVALATIGVAAIGKRK